jgi:hypothetical protein
MKRLGSVALVSLKPIVGQLAPELRLGAAADVGEQEPLIVAASLGERGRQALAREYPGEHFVGDRLGVNEHAVAVEDHKLVHRRPGTLQPALAAPRTASDCDLGSGASLIVPAGNAE